MSLREIDLLALFLWLLLDNLVVFRRKGKAQRREDRLSYLVIVLAGWTGIGLAIFFAFAEAGSLGRLRVPLQIAGLVLFAAGILLRSAAIAQLGRFHTPVVAIQEEHRVVDTGLYRRVRHPSYLGACIAFLGFGLALGSYLSPLALLCAAVPGYLYRIHVEERALLASLGDAYASYRKRTRRLIPGLY